MNRHAGRVAIVTGAATGFGRALAEELRSRGARVVLSDLRPAVEEVARSLGNGARGVVTDVRDPEAVGALVEGALQREGRLDLMINNAGVLVAGEVRDLGLDDWELALDVNLRGVVHGVRAAYPVFVERGGGHLVNVASLSGLGPTAGFVPYAAAKHGVVGLSLSLRTEAAALGVRVSVVCPGPMATGIFRSARALGPAGEDLERRLPVDPLPVERGARIALRGIERNRAVIPVGGYARTAWLAQRLAPGLVLRLVTDRWRRSRS